MAISEPDWVKHAVFWHIYPLGALDAEHQAVAAGERGQPHLQPVRPQTGVEGRHPDSCGTLHLVEPSDDEGADHEVTDVTSDSRT